MKVDNEEIRRIAQLSKLILSPAEEEEMISHFNKMLKQMETLDNFDASSVSPTANILPMVNVLREDIAESSMEREKLLANASESDGAGYIVPRVVE